MAFFYKWWLRPNLLTRYPSHRIVLQVDIQIWLVVEPTHLNNIRQNGFIFPKFRGEHKKYLSCHHLEIIAFRRSLAESSSLQVFLEDGRTPHLMTTLRMGPQGSYKPFTTRLPLRNLRSPWLLITYYMG